MKLPIYLDYNAATPVDPEVFEAMKPWFTEKFGNPSSTHTFGFEADAAVKYSRELLASFIGAEPLEIYFTSGATESINLVHSGIASVFPETEIISTVIEHPASQDSLKALELKGVKVTYLGVNREGFISIDELKSLINKNTKLVSLIAANNEIGVIQDIKQIGAFCTENNVLFHLDASQAVGKIPFNVNNINADLVSFNAHKIYGPKGIGALYIRNRVPKIKLHPALFGGGQERGLRPGTLNVPGITGFGKAVELCSHNFETEIPRIKELRDKLYNGLISGLPDVQVNGSMEKRLVNNLNISFEGVKSETLMSAMREIAVSTGSACSSANLKPSHVLKALGLSDELARSSVRFGVGRFTTGEEISYTLNKIIKTVEELRINSPVYKTKATIAG